MILVTLTPSFTLGLAFSHPKRLEALPNLIKDERGIYKKEVRHVRHSVCQILHVKDETLRLDEHAILAQATVRCHPKDNFSKEEGRKRSLKEALKVVHPPLNVGERFKVWSAYLNRPRPKSVPPPPPRATVDLAPASHLTDGGV